MTGPVLAVALIVILGVPLAAAVTRNALLAILLAPLVTALTATLAAILMLVAGAGSLLLWAVLLLVLQYAAVPRLYRRTRALPHASWSEFRWLVLPLLAPLLLVFATPDKFDAHSIWWLHAGYLTRGSAFARASFGNPALQFTHNDYPPLASAPVALVWSVRHTYNAMTAQFVSTAVTFAAIAALTYAVRASTDRARAAVSRLAAVGAGLAAWGPAFWTVAGGYSDTLWIAALAAAAVLLLVHSDGLTTPALPIGLATVAALTKNEALVVTVLLAVLASVRWRYARRRAAWVWVPVLAGLGWRLLAGALGAVSDVTGHADVAGLLTGDPAVYRRLPPTLAALWHNVGPTVAAAVAVAILGRIFLRTPRRRLGLGSDGWLWALIAGYAASLLVTYTVDTAIKLDWWLDTSADRVSLPLSLLSAVSAACWMAAAADAGTRAPAGAPARVAVPEQPVPEGAGVGGEFRH